MLGMRITVNLLGIVSTIILARLLTPEDFGLVALAGSAYAFFALFGQLGFDIPLIQLQTADRSHYDTAWTANILVGLVIAVAMLVVAQPAAVFFQDERIEYIVYSFAILSLAKGCENIGVVNFRKQLAFRGEFLYFVVPKLTSLTVGITAALILRNYWALVIGMVSAQVAGLLYSHFAQPFRPRLSLSKFSELFKFTKWILGIKVLRYLTFNGIEIILGRLRGPTAVGLYGIASQVAYLPSTEIAAPTKRALFPSFSTISSDTERLRSAFVKVFAVVALVTMPAALGILAVSDSLVFVVFGEKWAESGPILTVLALVGLLDVTNNLGEPVLLARAALRSLFVVLSLHAVILLVSAILLVEQFGAIGAAYAMLLSSLVSVPMYLFAAKIEIGYSLSELARHLWRPLFSAVLMAAAVRLLESGLVGGGTPTVLILLTLVATGILVYSGTLSLLWLLSGRPSFPEMFLFNTLSSRLKSRRHKSAPVLDDGRA